MTRADVAVLAVDLGSSNGRGMLGRFDGERIALGELIRFANGPVAMVSGLHWDVPMLMGRVEAAIGLASAETGGRLEAIGVDTWGVDYGLLDREGRLLGPPFAYRDARTEGMIERVLERISADELYRLTGNQTVPINTVFQLMSERDGQRWDDAATLLMMPDLFARLLTGDTAAERTIASTTQLYDPRASEWSDRVIDALEWPRTWFPAIVEPGTVRGNLLPEVARRTGAPSNLRLVTVGGHDTASAFAATPTAVDSFVISVGTWSLAGVERTEPMITEEGRAANLSNEVGVAGTIRLLKNAGGMWLLQQCRDAWGDVPDWTALDVAARAAAPFQAMFDPDDPRLLAPGDMPARIRAACVESGFAGPEAPGEMARTILECLALRYRELVEEMERVTGQALPTIHVVGGGARNRLLCRMTADATGRTVLAGPAEATALGNAGVQLMALGHVDGLAELREVVGRSIEVEKYEATEDRGVWEEAYGRFRELVGRPRATDRTS